ncbi:MAG TPA: hypothetical protein VJI67_01290 [archaeon]|nr:hypothetical protein [archaeon]HLD81150.1 hypothetical protein [archaeon]
MAGRIRQSITRRRRIGDLKFQASQARMELKSLKRARRRVSKHRPLQASLRPERVQARQARADNAFLLAQTGLFGGGVSAHKILGRPGIGVPLITASAALGIITHSIRESRNLAQVRRENVLRIIRESRRQALKKHGLTEKTVGNAGKEARQRTWEDFERLLKLNTLRLEKEIQDMESERERLKGKGKH